MVTRIRRIGGKTRDVGTSESASDTTKRPEFNSQSPDRGFCANGKETPEDFFDRMFDLDPIEAMEHLMNFELVRQEGRAT